MFSKKFLFNKTNIKIQLWELGGQKKYRSVLEKFIMQGQAIILVYDVTNESSFIAINDLIKEIKKYKKILIITLVGQKCDSKERVITEEKGRELANELGVEFFEVSAKTGQNINELFDCVTQYCIFAARDKSPDLGSK